MPMMYATHLCLLMPTNRVHVILLPRCSSLQCPPSTILDTCRFLYRSVQFSSIIINLSNVHYHHRDAGGGGVSPFGPKLVHRVNVDERAHTHSVGVVATSKGVRTCRAHCGPSPSRCASSSVCQLCAHSFFFLAVH